MKVAAAGLALLVAFVPRGADRARRRRSGRRVLIALQLAATHWFYLYVVWFVPFVLVALFAGRLREPVPERAAEREPAREREAVAASEAPARPRSCCSWPAGRSSSGCRRGRTSA